MTTGNAMAMGSGASAMGFIRAAILICGLFLILIVNREFGVADNGDFTRYIGAFAEKPADMDANWPPNGTRDFDARFFRQPHLLWTATAPGRVAADRPWFTSAALFWSAGNALGRVAFSADVVNTRYSGLPFFLFTAGLFVGVAACMRTAGRAGALGCAVALLPLLDARLSAYFNSYYAESVPILALTATFAFLMSRAVLAGKAPSSARWTLAWGTVAVALLCLAVLAKRQYIYLALPATALLHYVIFTVWWAPRRVKWIAFAGAIAVFMATVGGLSYVNRVKASGEADAARLTSYHALYYGLLPHAKDPDRLLRTLGLPHESSRLIGTNVWSVEAQAFVRSTPQVNIRTFIRAIGLQPRAFLGSVAFNAREIGHFDIPLGMVPGGALSQPPAAVAWLTSASSRLAGHGYLVVGLLSGLALLCAPFGLGRDGRIASAFLAGILLSVLLADVVISTFDGQQEARKHVLIGSLACSMLILQLLGSAGYFMLSLGRDPTTRDPSVTPEGAA